MGFYNTAIERLGITKTHVDVYQKTNQFKAVALTSAYDLPDMRAGTVAGGGGALTPTTKKVFRGRILGPHSPHMYLPNPCDLATTANPTCAASLIVQHTEFVLTDDYYSSGGDAEISRNDIVNVILRAGPQGAPFNLQFGDAVSINRRFSAASRQAAEVARVECESLVDIFENASAAAEAAATGTEAPVTAESEMPYTEEDYKGSDLQKELLALCPEGTPRSTPPVKCPALEDLYYESLNQDPDLLTPEMQGHYNTIIEELGALGYTDFILGTTRTAEGQAAAYELGYSECAMCGSHFDGNAMDLVTTAETWEQTEENYQFFTSYGAIVNGLGLDWGGDWYYKGATYSPLTYGDDANKKTGWDPGHAQCRNCHR